MSARLYAWTALRPAGVAPLLKDTDRPLVVHLLQDGLRLHQAALRRLHQGDGVLGVALGYPQAPHLDHHAAGDGQAGGVVGGAVDAVAGGKALDGLG